MPGIHRMVAGSEVKFEQMTALCLCRAKTSKFSLDHAQIADITKLIEVEDSGIRITRELTHQRSNNQPAATGYGQSLDGHRPPAFSTVLIVRKRITRSNHVLK